MAEHKTVSGIAREFADAPDQSCLNRFLTESPWEPDRLNDQRLEWLQHDPTTRYRQDGVIPIDNTFGPIMNHIQRHSRGYGGDLKFNRLITVSGQDMTVSAWTATLGPLVRTKFTVGNRTQGYFTKTVRLPKVNHPVRLLVLWSSADATEPRKVLVTTRIHWEAHRILKVYKRRWSGTETYHRDGKQHLGMGEGQLRDGMGQTRHMHLVMVVYTALMRQLKHDRALDRAHTRLMTIGESGRAIARETLGKTLAWVVEQAQQGMSLPDIQHRLALD